MACFSIKPLEEKSKEWSFWKWRLLTLQIYGLSITHFLTVQSRWIKRNIFEFSHVLEPGWQSAMTGSFISCSPFTRLYFLFMCLVVICSFLLIIISSVISSYFPYAATFWAARQGSSPLSWSKYTDAIVRQPFQRHGLPLELWGS